MISLIISSGMVSISRVLLFMACCLALQVSSRRELVAIYDQELAPSFKNGAEAEADTSTFETPDVRTSMLRIRSRFILENIHKGKAKKPEEMMESSDSKPRERSLIGTNDKSRSLPGSVLWNIPRNRSSKREELPGFDSDYCQPQTHPPSHN